MRDFFNKEKMTHFTVEMDQSENICSMIDYLATQLKKKSHYNEVIHVLSKLA